MQTQAELGAQPGQSKNVAQLVRSSFPLARTSVGVWRAGWHNDDDANLRREMLMHIMKLLHKPGMENKLSEIVNHLEVALYFDAASKDEYRDLNTLEGRICAVMLRIKNNQNSTQHGAEPGSVLSMGMMTPTPGSSNTMALTPGSSAIFSTSGNVKFMSAYGGARGISNIGSASAASAYDMGSVGPTPGLGSNIFSAANGQVPSLGVCGPRFEKNGQLLSSTGMARTGSQMIPTPGLNSTGSSAVSNFHNANEISINKLKQQQLATGSGCQIFGGMNAQRDGMISSNAQLGSLGLNNGVQFTGRGQIPTNGTSLPVSSGYSNVTQRSVQMYPQYSQQHVGQSVPQLRFYGTTSNSLAGVTGDGYAMNATDLTECGNLYNSVLSTGPGAGNAGVGSLTSAPAMMIPVPGMLSEQQDLLLSQNVQPQHPLISHHSALLQSPTFPMGSQQQQQQQLERSLVIPNLCEVKERAAETQNGLAQPPFSAPPARDTLEKLICEQHQSQLQKDQPSVLAQKLQTEQAFQIQGNQDLSWMDQDHQKDIVKTFHLQSEPHQLQQQCQQGSSADQQVEHSEQTCQANSADTGQSEVVSNDESLAPRQANGAGSAVRVEQLKRQRWFLLFLRHVSRCTNPQGQCAVVQCEVGRRLWLHLITCHAHECQYPRCSSLKSLLMHHQYCRDVNCPVCAPVRNFVTRQMRSAQAQMNKVQPTQPAGSTPRSSPINEAGPPPAKRVKVGAPVSNVAQAKQQPQQSVITMERPVQTNSQETLLAPKQETAQSSTIKKTIEVQAPNRPGKCKSGLSSLKVESPTGSLLSAGSQVQGHTKVRLLSNIQVEPKHMKEDSAMQVSPCIVQESTLLQPKQEAVASAVITSNVSPTSVKPAKMKIPGISYIEHFAPQQIREHISSLRKWIGQSKGKAERNQAMEHQMTASACSACAVENLSFDPIPIYCTPCGCRIKRNSTYHTTGSGESCHYFCGPCYNTIRADIAETDGTKYQKTMLEKKKNDEQRNEGWVECDKCKKWQHQICVLFNARINKERSEYTCPECLIAEMERGERIPRPKNSVLGAKDLPRTVLSDHVEERLAWKLEQERIERAKALGKNPEEVPVAEGLVVRVISSVDKKLEVKERFLELFQQEDYPKEFLYKSKMLLLFQQIEGVEVCLFGMYVQEFGADCAQPNQRRVYLSYLDSVKYFRPDVKTVTGEALRTFVYHEILIAYLDYCKKRGFSSCYIWACPPLKGEDYILYCHPEIQKTPKSDKLREWYLSMIAKAKKENIVVANKNLYEYFFTSNGESKAKVTAARLPYFDGDYWPGAAEDILEQLQKEEDGLHSHRRGKAKKVATKRSSKTSANAELAGNDSRDLQLMHKLGQSIVAMKEDFIMVHMHHACTHCRGFITSGHRWVCQQCADNFQLCSCCYEEHQKLVEEERHPSGKKEWHPLIMVEVNEVPTDTCDRDEIMESEFFDNRQAFLSLCQGNQYQYDTLRRAKHSSMMVLYHLHNPNAPAFITSCSMCHTEVDVGQGWKCKTCSDFDVCNTCFSSQEIQRHPHKLVPRPAAVDQSAQNMEARQQRLQQLRTMLEVLVHASQCREPSCQYAKCRNMKDLFRHGIACTKRAQGGCSLCKRMWFLLQSHARSCKGTKCHVPRCMDLREHSRRAQLQQESRRRAAVNEMIRQRAAEAAGGSR